MPALIPTMWRTCRLLANSQRLRCLRQVIDHPGGCVGDYAQSTGLPVAVASQYLRDLQARGLIGVQRRSRWFFNAPTPNASVEHAAALLNAAHQAMRLEAPPFPVAAAVFAAFAHSRRLAIVRFLHAAGTAGTRALRHNTGISARALHRHLHDLAAVGVVDVQEDTWRLADLPGALIDALTRACCD